ncbi:LacI family DNA-binding transcriptional regulator, partial [Streptomyces caniscabiei]
MGNDMAPEETELKAPARRKPDSATRGAEESEPKDPAARGRITIREVAVRAGVSTATASRALSGNHPVPAATRAR